ncbi:MAG: hypothetical protein A2896_02195 [Candidatus Nealsonbacteria bacterium RIFCSPLOWO2_01_FULL_43_32]|uniref:Prokaryotic-type class I peptide chain release factors domain-containing protein n=1 Tax=Candidatus Nealsonbacteria bacterium RIFCSPLOWO2_01_FULL_43_32 TaxID=1801672 RepID=A0A1G2EG79_9BACT|nr:MAG: hypothetical protein A2896_02195 [Candidatus Nealsonbacteria bacterium RIFCSPLOWO2_01_FULL_43_32]
MHYNLQDLKKQTRVFYSTSTGPGGQRRDKKKTGVRLLHLPSGIIVSVDERRVQAQNKKLAFELLQARLEKLSRPRKKRIPTKIPQRAKEKRLQAKRTRSQKKQLRRLFN